MYKCVCTHVDVYMYMNQVGGRYSVCSAVGMLPLSIHYGYPIMQSFLDGAHNMDTHFFSAPFKQNIPVGIVNDIYIHIYIHTYTYIYIYIYVCVYLCVFVLCGHY